MSHQQIHDNTHQQSRLSTRRMARRVGSAVGAAALGAMVLAGPVSAASDPGPVPNDPIGPSQTVSESGVEYVQVGLGTLGGMALGGAAVVAAGRARHRHEAHAA